MTEEICQTSEKLFNTGEAGKVTGRSPGTIRYHARRGTIPAKQVGPYKFSSMAIADFKAATSSKHTSKALFQRIRALRAKVEHLALIVESRAMIMDAPILYKAPTGTDLSLWARYLELLKSKQWTIDLAGDFASRCWKVTLSDLREMDEEAGKPGSWQDIHAWLGVMLQNVICWSKYPERISATTIAKSLLAAQKRLGILGGHLLRKTDSWAYRNFMRHQDATADLAPLPWEDLKNFYQTPVPVEKPKVRKRPPLSSHIDPQTGNLVQLPLPRFPKPAPKKRGRKKKVLSPEQILAQVELMAQRRGSIFEEAWRNHKSEQAERKTSSDKFLEDLFKNIPTRPRSASFLDGYKGRHGQV